MVVFQSCEKRLSTYDHGGCLVFDSSATWKTDPTLLARAWAKANGVKKRVTEGKWL